VELEQRDDALGSLLLAQQLLANCSDTRDESTCKKALTALSALVKTLPAKCGPLFTSNDAGSTVYWLVRQRLALRRLSKEADRAQNYQKKQPKNVRPTRCTNASMVLAE
jgi:hypothetical protein